MNSTTSTSQARRVFAFVRTVVGAVFFDEADIGIKVCPPSCVPHHKQAQNLPNSIPQGTLRGIRDAALIGLLLGCGFRRSEAITLRLGQIQQREEPWILADLVGKVATKNSSRSRMV